MNRLFLSRRNLLTLINKLDRNRNGGPKSACSLIFSPEPDHPRCPTNVEITVTAVEDDQKYLDRRAGRVMDAPNGAVPIELMEKILVLFEKDPEVMVH
jgi:hypothetical protein